MYTTLPPGYDTPGLVVRLSRAMSRARMEASRDNTRDKRVF